MNKLRSVYSFQKGFTLIELIIVIAILGVLAVVAVANMGTFLHISRVNAANSELDHVQIANRAYYNDKRDDPFASDSNELYELNYLNREPKNTFIFDSKTGEITDVEVGYDNVTWNGSAFE